MALLIMPCPTARTVLSGYVTFSQVRKFRARLFSSSRLSMSSGHVWFSKSGIYLPVKPPQSRSRNSGVVTTFLRSSPAANRWPHKRQLPSPSSSHEPHVPAHGPSRSALHRSVPAGYGPYLPPSHRGGPGIILSSFCLKTILYAAKLIICDDLTFAYLKKFAYLCKCKKVDL